MKAQLKKRNYCRLRKIDMSNDFVFNKKYAVSGAQSIEVFLEALQRVD